MIHIIGIAQQQQRKKQQEQSKKNIKGKRKRRAAAVSLVEEESMDTEEISRSQKNLSLSDQEQVHVHKLTVEATKVSIINVYLYLRKCVTLETTMLFVNNGTVL